MNIKIFLKITKLKEFVEIYKSFLIFYNKFASILCLITIIKTLCVIIKSKKKCKVSIFLNFFFKNYKLTNTGELEGLKPSQKEVRKETWFLSKEVRKETWFLSKEPWVPFF